ncbi:MAG: hypothetical protein ACRD2L_23945, partial [Terriglobia bacterium]
ECGSCVEFIHSHMVNRFKGALAELLALKPCAALLRNLQSTKELPIRGQLYWGDMIQQPRRVLQAERKGLSLLGSFAPGADGLFVEHRLIRRGKTPRISRVCAVIEVKSRSLSSHRALKQIEHQLERLRGGLKLGTRHYPPSRIAIHNKVKRIIVAPSSWRLNREWRSVQKTGFRSLLLPAPSLPPVPIRTQAMAANIWRITLDWSDEAIEQAAYEMTYWYMARVGEAIYRERSLPKEWAEMTSAEAGHNAIKMMLCYIPLRYISARQDRLATKLYNIYCFGYPLGIDSRDMLWPEDFPSPGLGVIDADQPSTARRGAGPESSV